jgi:hypothetical protein
MRFEKRIRALEARFNSDPAIIHLPDGSVREICGRGDYLLELFAGALSGLDLDPGQAADLELIRRCVAAKEPGGGHMVELIQCFLNAPAEQV